MKKLLSYLVILILIFTTSCGQIIDDPNQGGGNTEIINPGNNTTTPPNGDPNTNEPGKDDKTEFSVSLIYNKKVYTPGKDEKIQVVWADDYSRYTETIGSDGFAKTKLDGDFNVYLNNVPEGYSYNPNIYRADNDNPVVEIELYKLSRISKGSGTKLYDEYQMSSTGVYRTTISKSQQKVYYEYKPTKAGYYVLETMVNVFEDSVNPKVDIYQGTFAYKPQTPNQAGLDSGGYSLKNGFVKNVKWVVKLTEEQVSNVYTFAIYADSKTGVYPINVDFKITYEGEYYVDDIVSKLINAEEIHSLVECANCHKTYSNETTSTICTSCGGNIVKSSKPTYNSSKYMFVNTDGGIGNYYGGSSNGSGLLIGSGFKYNEETGFWHVYNNTTGEFGPVLCAKITQPCAYYEEALNMIESHGNKNLTVSNGTENYKVFVEQQYAGVCNADGVCFVTNEMKEFLQKFSVAQRLFFDGNGFVESTGVYAAEEDQWLFACGYYVEIK